ncbi:tetraacyldisaccharide 4'-kinase [Bacterioplanes sanyensis]|uniref:Tetraacyldisaccharide 4'-kinase n=1 Tax=Bacterioplanes sanyensis TaxID=1249553 RepID=A0A222FNM5_9GAMM|nr:tetraacyldisaccharide 4'-kinase [Bacterioplanes sanyensis]ASP39981.1 tetraacyldisaccharide 4'-kinase [Bacterioplanes sanyensis]
MNKLSQRISDNWYRPWWHNAWLLPLQSLSSVVVNHRWRRLGSNRQQAAGEVPVWVVGNLTVGGTGKTPLIIWLVERAQQLGLRPAIVSRGYGGKAPAYPLRVDSETAVEHCGDEPKLLSQRLNVPVWVDPQRARAVAAATPGADIIFSDDGLQHYTMKRSLEILVVDAEREFGNGWLLPIGPLREPLSRRRSVDMELRNGVDFCVRPIALVNALTGARRSPRVLQNQAVHAVAGIGNPQRFQTTLEQLGACVQTHWYPDHHEFVAEELEFGDAAAVVMTEKDWVKIRPFATRKMWYLQVGTAMKNSVRDQLETELLRVAERNA